jgi:hypothetical protein
MAGHPSASAKDDAALQLIFARSATKARPYPTCTAAGRPVHLGVISLSLNSTGNLKTPTTRTLPPIKAASLYSVSSAGLSPAVRTILIATTPSFKSAGPKFSKRVEHTTARGFLPEKKKKATMLRRTMDEAAFVGKMGIQSHCTVYPAPASHRRYKRF